MSTCEADQYEQSEGFMPHPLDEPEHYDDEPRYDASGFRALPRRKPVAIQHTPPNAKRCARLRELIEAGWSPTDAALAAHCEAREAGEIE